jgi:hypothetical protein
VIDHLGRVVIGLNPRVVIGEDNVDPAVPPGQQSSEAGNSVRVADVDHCAVKLGPGGCDRRQRVRDPCGIPARQVHHVAGVEPLGQPLHECKPEVASGACNQRNGIHDLMYIN